MFKKLAAGAAAVTVAGLAAIAPAQADTISLAAVITDEGDNTVAAAMELDSSLVFYGAEGNVDFEQYGDGEIDYDIDFEIYGEGNTFSEYALVDIAQDFEEDTDLSSSEIVEVYEILAENGLLASFVID
jgi:spore coat protein CotH